MKKQATVLSGEVINVGEWDYQPWTDDEGVVQVGNPMPVGAQTGEHDLAETAAGRIVLAGDYRALRGDEYPPIGDQLDAIWKGGDAFAQMHETILEIKSRYPKASPL